MYKSNLYLFVRLRWAARPTMGVSIRRCLCSGGLSPEVLKAWYLGISHASSLLHLGTSLHFPKSHGKGRRSNVIEDTLCIKKVCIYLSSTYVIMYILTYIIKDVLK